MRRSTKNVMSAVPEIAGRDAESFAITNLDESYFPTANTIESIALLQACLSTGLLSRAHKLMTDMRLDVHRRIQEMYDARGETDADFAYSPPLKQWTYNAILHAYLAKAAQVEEPTEVQLWISRAWELWYAMMDMGQPKLDPRPDAATIAAMALGVGHLKEMRKYPKDQPGLETLLRAARQLSIPLESVFSSSVIQFGTGEKQEEENVALHPTLPDANIRPDLLLTYFRAAASDIGDQAALHELDHVHNILTDSVQRLEKAEHTPLDPLQSVAQVRPVLKQDPGAADGAQQKPFNLQTLQESLAIMHDARMRVPDLYERQRWLEHSALDAARKRLEHDSEKLEELGLKTGALQSKTLQTWMWEWYQKLEVALTKDLGSMEKQLQMPEANAMDSQLYPFLSLIPPSKMAMIVILELMRMQGVGGVADGIKTTRTLLHIGKAIEAEHHATVINKHPEIFVQARTAQNMLKDRNLINMAMRRDLKAWQERCNEDSLETQIPKWTQVIRARVGSYLVRHLMDIATVHRKEYDRDGDLWEEEQPAFYAAYQYIAGKKLGVIRLNEVVGRRLDKESVRETLHPRHLPMLVPPKPWLTHDSGGYFSVKTSAMRYKDSIEQSSYLRAASENNGLEVVLAGLDVLGNTAWNINKEVFDVVLQVWNSGEELADMPPALTDEPEPERPPPDDIKAKGVYLQRMRQWNLNRASNHSQRCDINYKLEIARSFLGERFYFPHNMDFRGRAYPIPPNLNHIGNDLCRGLLKFADEKPLGKIGLRWLRIHLANVFGYDKASFQEREVFAIDHEHDIIDAAEHPLDGKRWWLHADDPWQCLATCFELYKALKHPEGPEAFPSQLPVHQDGTCNGLQHYAALGGDLHGAKQVNLSGGERPSDVYSGVADLVIAQLKQRASEGDHYATLLEDKVTRKVVKQTVMTTVYGVTFVGAKNQVMRQLVDRGDVPAEELWGTASYLAKVIMDCIGDLFTGANLIQEWLSVSARLIAKSIPPERIEQSMMSYMPRTNSNAGRSGLPALRVGKEQMTSVIWTTALGLPIVQPYRKVKKHQVSTAMQSVFIRDPNQNFEVNPSKQSSAFPPNFIHSLDATHMILTALECQSAGLVFASVHDSYWTHAADIETMSDVIRDTFVRLHSQDILVRLREEFLQRYKGYKIPLSSLTKASMLRSDRDAKKRDTEEVELEAQEITRHTRTSQDSALQAQFVDLADVLPAIPQKGDFDVNEIRRSLYFFS
ncbi:DNA-directed RNA polymerase [Malassezia vespertilionis]|uniref:DNA-directed RNA polymerase n=1 Tax=Malassezia vespertilionis TaxID=2020962 RepID=A0A2N1JAW6_9BASI|nr:DNA-directed RNA polymerase [Malassezia vespertilionis]PKI83694.1 Rpo41p [Malassezia vespertilionis]WFD07092.1 DNA-directed RNA polymerase [Malassezia vespertilionis]